VHSQLQCNILSNGQCYKNGFLIVHWTMLIPRTYIDKPRVWNYAHAPLCATLQCCCYKYLTTALKCHVHYYIQVNHEGQYITVPHIPEAIQVNIGGVMQRWTGDQYIAPVSILPFIIS